MDLLALLNALAAQLTDAQKAADELAVAKFAEGAASRQGEVDALKAEIEALKSNDPLQVQLDQALARVAELEGVVAAMQAQIDGFPQLVADAVAVEDVRIKELVLKVFEP